MSSTEAATDILRQVLEEFGSVLNIHGESEILVSDATIAKSIYDTTESVRTPFGPRIIVASQGQADPAQVEGIPNASVVSVNDKAFKMDFYTHAIFGIQSDDPKYVFGGLKHMRYGLRPKGYAVVISIKQDSVKQEDGTFTVSLEDKMKYQSRGKVNTLTDVVEFAEFERGRIKSFDKTANVGGEDVKAEVILAKKWDQLSA
ncbi:hypothetical protein DOTSEDRAFT_75231 [Dothistroma septosporum NZE10]|uniref:Uncharacterized protein n=1 Tax=Dothistroma septosporum (strain NZE10 / CBS 128990) TaxID=675120 RepID=M2YKJ3_DOTSN|nr:hypothetical protein DOTSEDRAFT_75231 [Dothistroma septosporum NZE10]